ncbi:hypothetical protein HJC99_00050 [Candidatus Saccharibacteria bacterium]|nr:hypothetical protein [Candidatus Saccharibacteria bacterium]
MIVYQRPNLIVIIALVFSLAAIFVPVAATGAVIAWSAWGYDEIRYGDGPLRRFFGCIAIVGVAIWLIWQ